VDLVYVVRVDLIIFHKTGLFLEATVESWHLPCFCAYSPTDVTSWRSAVFSQRSIRRVGSLPARARCEACRPPPEQSCQEPPCSLTCFSGGVPGSPGAWRMLRSWL
jgi:hypothetical protein